MRTKFSSRKTCAKIITRNQTRPYRPSPTSSVHRTTLHVRSFPSFVQGRSKKLEPVRTYARAYYVCSALCSRRHEHTRGLGRGGARAPRPLLSPHVCSSARRWLSGSQYESKISRQRARTCCASIEHWPPAGRLLQACLPACH